MTEASVDREYGCWSVAEHSIQIEYAQSVLTEIDRTVVDGFRRLRRGGIEVGGVLFGVRDGQAVRILAFRPLASEHALGPGFVLSKTDDHALSELLETAESDPALQGMIPVGWYHSHTRSHIHLSSKDIEVFDRHFPEFWQVALVLRPDHFQATKAGFFFREEEGRIHSEASYREFLLPPLREPQLVRTYKEMLAERAVQRPAPPAVPANRLLTTAPMTLSAPRQLARFAVVAVLAIAIVGGWAMLQRGVESRGDRVPVAAQPRIEPRVEPLSLGLEDHKGRLSIVWNRDAAPVRGSDSALLEITEGGRTSQVELDAGQLHSGTVVYDRTSQNVAVSLRAGGAEESAVFVGPPPPDADLRERSRELADARPSEPEIRTPPKPVIRKAPLPRIAARRPEPTAVSLPMPPIERVSSATPLATPLIGVLPAVPPAANSLAATGTLIWTGLLNKSGVLSIDGRRASTGAITGAIPGHPVRIKVYPAELTAAGLNVYSTNPKYPPGHLEPPGAGNGWNKTSYVQDARLGGALKVVEAPSPKNNWSRLVLRDEGVRLSVILIEWETQ